MFNRTIPPKNGNGANGALSPARAALAKHLAQIRWLSERVDALDKPRRDLELAEQAERDATVALEAVSDLEAADFKIWSKAASGPFPAPRERERTTAMEHLADAHAHSNQCRRAVEAVAGDLNNAVEKLSEAHGKIRELVRNVVIEEVLKLRTQHIEAKRQLAATTGALFGLRNSLAKLGDGNGMQLVSAVMATGCLPVHHPQANQVRVWPPVDQKLPKNARLVPEPGPSRFDPPGPGPMYFGPTVYDNDDAAAARAVLALAQEIDEVARRNERRASQLIDVLGRDPGAVLELDATPEKKEQAA